MNKSFDCPICGAKDWCTVKRYHYVAQENSVAKSASQNLLRSSNSLRKQILFDIWFPGEKEIDLHAIYCAACGFLCYSPRPDNDDLQAKYQFLSEREEIGALHNPTRRALHLDHLRELFMFRAIAQHHDTKSQKVLDVGGGDGRLMRPFMQEGCQCYVVDYNAHPYSGVERLGSTIEDIPKDSYFDIIICSHVLEHVCEPSKLLRQLRALLSDKGVIYIEVPLEVWKGIPIGRDPVTHINFFTVHSLRNALLLNKLEPLSIKNRLSSYGEQYKRVAWAVASSTERQTDISTMNSSHTSSLLQPKLPAKLARFVEAFQLNAILNSPLTFRKKVERLKTYYYRLLKKRMIKQTSSSTLSR